MQNFMCEPLKAQMLKFSDSEQPLRCRGSPVDVDPCALHRLHMSIVTSLAHSLDLRPPHECSPVDLVCFKDVTTGM